MSYNNEQSEIRIPKAALDELWTAIDSRDHEYIVEVARAIDKKASRVEKEKVPDPVGQSGPPLADTFDAYAKRIESQDAPNAVAVAFREGKAEGLRIAAQTVRDRAKATRGRTIALPTDLADAAVHDLRDTPKRKIVGLVPWEKALLDQLEATNSGSVDGKDGEG